MGAAEDASLWSQHMRLVGPVLVIGADDRTGGWVSLPEAEIGHAQHLLEHRSNDCTVCHPEK